MTTLLSKEHRILEKGMMEFRPFGKEPSGAAIRDISGISVGAHINYLEEITDPSMVEKLVQLLNDRIPDRAYHVTSNFLKSPWNSYSLEFVVFLTEFCSDLSGDAQFSFNMAREKFISPIMQALMRPFTVSQIFKRITPIVQKFSKNLVDFDIIEVTDHSAILRVWYTEHAEQQMGHFRKACAQKFCLASKGIIYAMPEKVHRLAPAIVADRTCVAEGDQFCEWHITWQAEEPHRRVIPAISNLARRILTKELEEREKILQEQVNSLAARHEELGDAYAEQQELIGSLEEKVRERTAELETANKHLKELDRVKSEFFANISHELRTPLTLIFGSFYTLLKQQLSQDCQSVAQSGLRNASRLLGLINELLDLAKLDSGRMELRKGSVDLVALVREVSANFESDSKRKIYFRGFTQPVLTNLDRRQFKKVLDNLLSNAFKFNDSDQAVVWIRLKVHDDLVELEVEDNGIGIPADQLGAIFERFTQVEGSATRRFEGTGIGLALAKEIVALHGGQISVDSDVGQGTTFKITLPHEDSGASVASLEADDELTTTPLVEPQTSSTPEFYEETTTRTPVCDEGTLPLVLAIDDNPDMCNYFHRLLKKRFRVMVASDGMRGLEQAKTGKPDLIVTDVMMPRMSGYDLVRAIRCDQSLHSVPVIFVTARAGLQARIECLEAGADDYISKPFEEEELWVRIGNLLRIRREYQELVQLNSEKLKRFPSPQLAELITSGSKDTTLQSHRGEISVVFLDLRGFTAFAESAAPEDLMGVLREYHAAMGQLCLTYGGTLERFAGDGIMVFFNDPVPIPNHTEQAVRMAVAMQKQMEELRIRWRSLGFNLGLGIGIAAGYATMGVIGFEGRWDYGAIGPVTNLAARLCSEAQDGQIVVSERFCNLVAPIVATKPLGSFVLKGFQHPVAAFNIVQLK